MAEIDARIPLMAQQAKIPDLTEMYGNAANMANLMQQTQLNRLNYQGTMALNQALQDQSNIDPNTGAPDVGKVLGGVAGQGFGAAPAVLAYGKNATDIAKTRAETGLATANTQKSLADAHTARLDAQGKLIGIEGQLLSGVTDQASYDKVLQMARTVDPNGFSDAPAQYDPAYVQKRMQQAVSVGEQIKNQLEQYKNVSGRISAQAAASQAGTAAGRLGLDVATAGHKIVPTALGPFSMSEITGMPTGASVAPGGGAQPAIAINPGDIEQLKLGGEENRKKYDAIQQDAQQAATAKQLYGTALDLSKTANIGKGGALWNNLQSIAVSSGIAGADAAKAQSSTALLHQILEKQISAARNSGDTKMAGAFTQAQQQLERGGLADTAQSGPALRAALQSLINQSDRKIQYGEFTQNYHDEHGGKLDDAFNKASTNWLQAHNPITGETSSGNRPPLSSYHGGGQ